MGKQLNDVELWERYIANGRPVHLRNRLAELNLKLIYEVINKTKRINHELEKEDADDLFQQGYLGLNSAIERFEMGEGRYFYAFAFPFIYGRLMSWLRDKSRMIRIPVMKHDMIMRSFKIKQKLEAKGHNNPTLKEIFALVPEEDQKIGFAKWRGIIEEWHQTKTSSFDTKVKDEDSSFLDFIPSKDYQEEAQVEVKDEVLARYPELLSIFLRLAKKRCFEQEGRETKKRQAIKHFSVT